MNRIVNALGEQILDICEQCKNVEAGTEEYDSLVKEMKTVAEAISALPQVDKTKVAMEIAKTVGVVLAFLILVVFSIDHIVDSKPVNALRAVLGLI